jgi:hypothetical protein
MMDTSDLLGQTLVHNTLPCTPTWSKAMTNHSQQYHDDASSLSNVVRLVGLVLPSPAWTPHLGLRIQQLGSR